MGKSYYCKKCKHRHHTIAQIYRSHMRFEGKQPKHSIRKKTWKSDPTKYVVNEWGEKEMTINERLKRLKLR